jgi:hypothetical protein
MLSKYDVQTGHTNATSWKNKALADSKQKKTDAADNAA